MTQLVLPWCHVPGKLIVLLYRNIRLSSSLSSSSLQRHWQYVKLLTHSTRRTPNMAGLDKFQDLFRGSMVGALLGDCLGEPFEGDFHGQEAPSSKKLNAFFDDVMNRKPNERCKIMRYTDDTEMTKALAQSLIEYKTFNADDLAERFSEDYFHSHNRGYGGHVPSVFIQLRKSNYTNVLEPAQSQFNGTGSYGNGAAMRIAPVPLFTFNQDLGATINLAKQTSLLTHAHHNGYNGAIVLSLAIKEALQISNSQKKLEVNQFLDYLISKMDEVENGTKKVYKSKLEEIKIILEKDKLTSKEIAKQLGNDVTAPKSVPLAIYCFLRALEPIKDYKTDNPLVRTLYLAISMGGDTDTIASMAGAIAGAYHGFGQIPEVLRKQCEGIDNTIRQADQLTEIVKSRDL